MSRAPLALACFALGTGCVAVGWGRYPIAHGVGVETTVPTPFHTDTRVETPEVTLEIELSGYEGTMGFFGILLPLRRLGRALTSAAASDVSASAPSAGSGTTRIE